MMGKSHLLVGTAVAVSGVAALHGLRDGGATAVIALNSTISGFIHAWPAALGGIEPGASPGWSLTPLSSAADVAMTWLRIPENPLSLGGILFVVAALGLLWIGSVLPDIDSKNSTLGRYISFPGPHHGFTHTDWFLGLLLLTAIPTSTRLMFWLWLGAALHCWMDGLSQAGRVRFYPLTRYKIISLPSGGGACVAPAGNHVALYQVGSVSEVIVLAAAVSLGAAAAWLLLGL